MMSSMRHGVFFVFFIAAVALTLAFAARAATDSPDLSVPAGFAAVGAERDTESLLPMRIRHLATGYELVYVPAGKFFMGSPETDPDAFDPEMPERAVFVPGYWIGRTEVSNFHFRLFRPKHHSGNFRGRTLNDDSQPVVEVNWDEATAFCAWAKMRLPSEAEWEKAARGTDRRRFAWGNDMPPRGRPANIADSAAFGLFSQIPAVKTYCDGFEVSAPIASFAEGASPCGAINMTGNVEEWCQDGWDERMWDFVTSVVDVPDEAAQAHRIYRGGSYLSGPGNLRAARRESYPRETRENDIGFRAVVSPVPGR